MTPLRRRIARLAATLAVAAAAFACNAPFIPVPPPGQVVFTPALVADGAGGEKTVWTASGGQNEKAAQARFFLYDSDRQTGVITQADGSGAFVAPPMDGTRGDHVQVYYETPAGSRSDMACVLLIEGPDIAPRCP